MQSEFLELPNHIRIAYHRVHSPISHVGVLINTGSRDESTQEQGAAHLMEHMFFKGTKKRKAFHILNRIDEVGGELNAFTTKENTFIYASFLTEYTSRAYELMADILFNSEFPEKELEKEKAVIIDEIKAYRDDPSEEIGDMFDQLVFGNHPLGSNILGTEKSVKSFTPEKIKHFLKRTYTTDQMIVCYIGNLSFEKVANEIKKQFGHVKPTERKFKREKFKNYTPQKEIHKKDNHSCHGILGNIAYSVTHKNRIAFYMLNNLLGGPSLNSRLNMHIREKYGYTYYLESNYTPFDDTGLWWIYFATDFKNFHKTRKLIYRELRDLRNKSLGMIQMEKLKKQVKGQLALANENYSHLLNVMARSYLIFNKFESLESTYKKIDKVTASQILECANNVFSEDRISELLFESK
ncbi:MAG: insulinase family protein [Flavobacteriales bacterium]|nr:insulinase family protein [Flavobacteriales bacterium]